MFFFFFSSRRRHTRLQGDWSSDVCSSDLAPSGFTRYYDSIGFDWKRLASAEVLRIEGMDPYDYVDLVADTVTGTYLDHGVRVNSVFTSYRLLDSSFSQRF